MEKQKRETGDYETYADRWIIQNVEPGFKEAVRNNHNKGYHLKVWFGVFSKIGNKVFKGGKDGTVKDLKNNIPLKKRPK